MIVTASVVRDALDSVGRFRQVSKDCLMFIHNSTGWEVVVDEDGWFVNYHRSSGNILYFVSKDGSYCYIGQHDGFSPKGKGLLVTLTSPSNFYLGDFSDGVPNGIGKIVYANGSTYTGEFTSGLPNGNGDVQYP